MEYLLFARGKGEIMTTFTNAIVRRPGADFAKGLTTSGGNPDLALALHQHDKYIETLKALGLSVQVLPALEGHPDAVFVEDTALVAPEAAVITHPGAPSRVGETASIAQALAAYKPVEHITEAGATIDGGDVMLIGHTFYVGMSGRTNEAGMKALEKTFSKYGTYKCVPITVPQGLHLKSFVTQIAENVVLVTKELYNDPALSAYEKVLVPEGEEYSANTVLINGSLLMAEGFPKTTEACEKAGCKVILLDTSEYRKMDGALTCLSLRF
jgi:dimethylargininase